jgi:hypothetical protein
LAQKRQRPDFSSGRCHETPLKAPREFKTLTARPQCEVSARYDVFFIFFFFFGFVGVVAMT